MKKTRKSKGKIKDRGAWGRRLTRKDRMQEGGRLGMKNLLGVVLIRAWSPVRVWWNGAKHSPSIIPQGGASGDFGVSSCGSFFFRLQPDVFIIQKASKNKSFRFARVSNYEEFDSVNDFSPGPRDLSGWDWFWTDFGTFLDQTFKISVRMYQDQLEIKNFEYLW